MRVFRWFILLVAVFAASSVAYAESDPIYTGIFNNNAVGGYDAVSYFTDGKATPGVKEFSYTYKNATWFFASQAHLDLFKASPEKYAPQYGGYCAYALAKNDLVSSDPEAWRIVDGKLYLNYSNDIQKTWEATQSDYIQKADGLWPAILK